MSRYCVKVSDFYPTHSTYSDEGEALPVEFENENVGPLGKRQTNIYDPKLMVRMPSDVMFRIFKKLPCGEVEKYALNHPKGREQCKWMFDQGDFTTRVAIDFNVWVIDSCNRLDIEDSETIIVRIKWKNLNELFRKLNVVGKFLSDPSNVPFEYDPELTKNYTKIYTQNYTQNQIEDHVSEINKNTPFGELFNIVWTVNVFESVIDPPDDKSAHFYAAMMLDDLRSKWRIDVLWPAEDNEKVIVNDTSLVEQLKILLDYKQNDVDEILTHYQIPKDVSEKIKRSVLRKIPTKKKFS